MPIWLRVLIGLGVGIVGVILYALVRWYFETAKKATWAEVALATLVGLIGMVLAGFGDWILAPVWAAKWLRWVVTGVAAAASLTFGIGSYRTRSDEGIKIVLYVAHLVFAFFAIRLFIVEILGH